MNLPFVIPGHYTKNDTLDSETKTIIRVLGEGNNKDCFKVQNEKREFHENEILSSYTYTPTHYSEFSNNIELGEINEENENIEENTILEENIILEENSYENENHYLNKDETPKHNYSISLEKSIPIKSEEDIFVEGLLTKIINENQEIISIPINFSFKYDIEKLKNLIKLLDIDNKTVNLIVEKLIDNNLKQNLFSALKQTILNLVNNNIVKEPEKNIIQNNIIVENKEIQENKDNFSDKNDLFNTNLLNNKYL